mgnify:FL=1
MKKKILGFTIVASLFILTGCNKIPKLANGQELAAKIDGKEITVEEVYTNLRKQYGTTAVINIIDEFIANKEIETDEDATETAEFQLEQIKLNFKNSGQDFKSSLASYGYENEQDLLDEIIIEYKKGKMVENYYKELLTDEEINTHYEEEVFGEMDVRHILIQPEEKDNEEEQEKANTAALNKAKDLIKKLDDGANFEALVKEHSADTGSAEEGGLIKNVNKDEYVLEFFEASLELEKGKYTKTPVKSQFGYHIILKVEQKNKPSLESAKDKIIDTLVEEKINDGTGVATQLAWSEIRKKYNIEFFDKDIKRIYNSNITSLKNQE